MLKVCLTGDYSCFSRRVLAMQYKSSNPSSLEVLVVKLRNDCPLQEQEDSNLSDRGSGAGPSL